MSDVRKPDARETALEVLENEIQKIKLKKIKKRG